MRSGTAFIATIYTYSATRNGAQGGWTRIIIRGWAKTPADFGNDMHDLYGGEDEVDVGVISVSKDQTSDGRMISSRFCPE